MYIFLYFIYFFFSLLVSFSQFLARIHSTALDTCTHAFIVRKYAKVYYIYQGTWSLFAQIINASFRHIGEQSFRRRRQRRREHHDEIPRASHSLCPRRRDSRFDYRAAIERYPASLRSRGRSLSIFLATTEGKILKNIVDDNSSRMSRISYARHSSRERVGTKNSFPFRRRPTSSLVPLKMSFFFIN